MKKILLLAAAAIIAAGSVQAKTADELRIYLNPGHGSYGPNDRPCSTVGHLNTKDLADTDTLGFYEGRGTLQRAFGIATYLKKVGVKAENIVFSRLTNGPWPYNANDPDEVKYEYNRNLTEICEEVEAGNFDMFISDHSNANNDGDIINYPLFLYRGYDKGSTGDAGYNGNAVEGSWDMCNTVWDTHYMSELDPQTYYSLTSKNLRGDINFYGSYSTGTRYNGKQYSGYLGVLKHGTPGFLLEGFFHTYQPSRHRALNFDYDRQEGRREARGVGKYFGLPALTTGDIMGAVRDQHEKFSHTFYKAAPGTDDQLLPLNGSIVTLYKAGAEVASYTVDNEYNGIFVFEDLEPGEYTINVTHEGYKEMAEQYQVTVTADQTAYAKIFLENEEYVPDEEVYENYPDPDQPGYLKLANEFNFNNNAANLEIVGNVTSIAQLGDSTVILSNDGLTPHLYLINSKTQSLVKELSVEGIYSEESTGFYSPLYAITFTADHKLVGTSLTRNQYSDTQVDAGYTRGTTRVYMWKDLDSAPTLWATTQNAGNYYRANVGQSIAVNGPTKECQILLTAVNQGASPYNIRLVHMNIMDGEVTATFHDNLYNAGFTAVAYGDDVQGGHLHLTMSPNSDEKAVLGGSNGLVTEFTLPKTSAGNPSDVKQLSQDFNLVGYGFNFFKYAQHALMVAPYADANGAIKGVRLLDVTGGIDQAELIKTNNTDIVNGQAAPRKAEGDDASYYAATAAVAQADINLYLNGRGVNTLFTTENVNQPVVKGIYAYNLDMINEGEEYTFLFNANSDAVSGKLIFTNRESGEILGEWPLSDVTEGENIVTLTKDQIPGEDGMIIDWAVNLVGNTIPSFGLINNVDDFNYTYSFNTVDKSPESKHFGRIYVGNRPSSGSAQNGIYIYEPDYSLVNTEVFNTRTDGLNFGSNWRMAMDAEGKLYVPDWGDGGSGVFVYDPEGEQVFYPFFANEDGSPLNRASSGLLTNAAGESVASSTPGVSIAGTGANTKLFVYNEDMNNDVYVYNIGNSDGTIAKYWNQAPNSQFGVGAYQLNTNGNVWGYEDGSGWVSQYRGAGNNGKGVPSLMFVDPEGNITYNSGVDTEFAAEYMNGSAYAGFAISNDGKTLVINDANGVLQFFDLSWDGYTPILTPKYTFKATEALRSGGLQQINFDYAGNMICSGAKVGIYSVPTDDNQATTPARSELFIDKSMTSVNGIEVNKAVKSVKYVNAAGMQSNRPFEGLNIVVTTYDDGTQSVVKVMK